MVIANDHYQSIGIISGGVQCVTRKRSISFNNKLRGVTRMLREVVRVGRIHEMSRGRYEDATRKLLPCNLGFTEHLPSLSILR